MKWESFIEAARLFKCVVSEDSQHVTLGFPKMNITISKDFATGEAEAVLFVVTGWMKILRQALDGRKEVSVL